MVERSAAVAGEVGLGWSKRKLLGYGFLFVAVLWFACFSLSALSIEALLRITY